MNAELLKLADVAMVASLGSLHYDEQAQAALWDKMERDLRTLAATLPDAQPEAGQFEPQSIPYHAINRRMRFYDAEPAQIEPIEDQT